MANPTGFQSWSDYLALNRDAEQRLLDQAVQEAEATQGQANTALMRAGRETTAEQMRQAKNGVATATLSQAGSYSDYVKLKLKAEGQYQAAQLGGNSVSSEVRRRLAATSPGAKAWQEHNDALKAREAQLGAESEANASSTNTYMAGRREADAKKAGAEAARARADADLKRGFYADVQKRWGAANAFDLFGRPGENRSDQTQLARYLAAGRAGGAWSPASGAQSEDVTAQAWGSPRGRSAVGTGVSGTSATRDAFGRLIDARTGKPLYGFGETGE